MAPLLDCPEASKHHLLKFGFFLLDRQTLVSYWVKTCYCAHHTFLLGFPTGRSSRPHHSASALFECGLRSLELFSLGSSTSTLFDYGLWSLELFSSGQQRLCVIRLQALVPRIILFGLAAPLRYSTAGFSPSNYSLRASSASTLFECGCWSLESHLSAISAFILFRYGPLSFESLFCAINAFELPEIWQQYASSEAVCQIRR
jgi:hypothetical protein